MSNIKTIALVKDFHRKPFGRYIAQYGERSGEFFRSNILVPALKESDYVHVTLDGYNKYGRSFIDESFGGLIREEGYTYDYLKEHLTYSHSLVKSFEGLIDERLIAAREESK
ncbi:STAS-like domain-containing protein [Cobetia amphilecti]|nr:STAS-like domain-containing protein [Cobetia litoralis]